MKQRNKLRLLYGILAAVIFLFVVIRSTVKAEYAMIPACLVTLILTGILFWLETLLVVDETKVLEPYRAELMAGCIVVREKRFVIQAGFWTMLIFSVALRIYVLNECFTNDEVIGLKICQAVGIYCFTMIYEPIMVIYLIYLHNFRLIVGKDVVIYGRFGDAVKCLRIDDLVSINDIGDNGSYHTSFDVYVWPDYTLTWTTRRGGERLHNYQRAKLYIQMRRFLADEDAASKYPPLDPVKIKNGKVYVYGIG